MPSEGAQPAERRLHPASIVFGIGQAARTLLLPGLVVLFAYLAKPVDSRGNSYEIWLMILFVPAVLATLLRFFTYRYRLDRDEMVIREGVLTRNERHIPYSRIQNIDLVQNPMHRLLDVALVRLETASGRKPEAVIRVLSLAAIEEMRGRVQASRSGPVADATSADEAVAATDPPRESELLRLGGRDLVVLGLISNRGMAVVAAALGVAWQFGTFEQADALPWLSRFRVALPDGLSSGSPPAMILIGLGIVLLALALIRLLSVAWTVFKFHGFRLVLREDDLRSEYGLLTRVTATIPRRRIQLLSMREGFLHRHLGRVSLQVETAGGGQAADGDGPGSERRWLAPVARRADAARIVARVLPGIDIDSIPWQPLAPGARDRLLRRSLILLGLISAPAIALGGVWGALVLVPGLPLALVHPRLYVRHAGWALLDGAVLYRSGWWTRRLSAVLYGKVQVLALGESPFDRRTGMASVRVDTAGAGRIGHRIDIAFLERATAGAILGRLYGEAGRTAFRW